MTVVYFTPWNCSTETMLKQTGQQDTRHLKIQSENGEIDIQT